MKKITKLSVITLTFCAVLTLGSTASISMHKSFANEEIKEFKDVTKKHWAYQFVRNGVNKGFINGYEDGTFKPSVEVRRHEFVKMLTVALGVDVGDTSDSSPWYKPYVSKAMELGYLHEGDFGDKDYTKPILRKEMVKLMFAATDETVRDPKNRIGSDIAFYETAKKGLIKGLVNGDLGGDKGTTRAEAAVVIDRILQSNAGIVLPVDKVASSIAEYNLTGANVKTMLGLDLVSSLPIKVDMGYGLDSVVDKIKVIDFSTTNRPFKDQFPDIIANDKPSKTFSGYVISMHVKIRNKGRTNYVGRFWSPSRELLPIRGGVITTSPSVNYNDFPLLKQFSLSENTFVEGWFTFRVTSEEFKLRLNVNNFIIGIESHYGGMNKLTKPQK